MRSEEERVQEHTSEPYCLRCIDYDRCRKRNEKRKGQVKEVVHQRVSSKPGLI